MCTTVKGRGHTVTQLVKVLRYKPEGRGFDSRWCHWKLSLTQSFRLYYYPGVDSASKINEYNKYFLRGIGGRCVGLTLSFSCAECLEIWEPVPPGTREACADRYRDCFTFYCQRKQATEGPVFLMSGKFVFEGTCSELRSI